MPLNLQSTLTQELAGAVKTWYDKKLIRDMKPKLVHLQYAQMRPVPKNGGKSVSFRRWTPFAACTTALDEGVVPNGQNLSVSEVGATLEGYGGYVAITDMLDLTSVDPVVNEAVALMADQGALSIDTLVRDALHAGTNVVYADGGASRAALTPEDVLTTGLLRAAVRDLKKRKAPTFMRNGKGYYIAIVGPDTVYDLQNDAAWVDVSKYQASEQIFSGEIGRIFGVIVVETPEAMIFTGAGAQGCDIASTLVLGQNAYGVVDIANEKHGCARTIIKPAGSGGTSDPLDQISTVGWKVDAFAVRILQQAWLTRIEHGVSA